MSLRIHTHYPLLVRAPPSPRPDSTAPTLMRLIPIPPTFTWKQEDPPQLCSLPPTSVCLLSGSMSE